MMAQVVVFVIGAALLAAQTRTFPIVSLKVDGNRTFSQEQILAVAGLKLGQPAEEKAFEAARERLLASGYFETVGYRFGPSGDKRGYAASFQVLEVAQVFPVRFERLEKSGELAAALRKADPLFGDTIPGTQPVLTRYAEILTKIAGEKVVGRVAPDTSGALTARFEPARMPPSIAEVRFVKNEAIPTTPLQNAIAGTAIGVVYEEKRFRQLLDAGIRPMYEERGRVRVSFPKVTTEPVMDVNGLRVTVEVSEGEVYTLGDVKPVLDGASEKDLLRAAALKKGDIANFTEIQRGVERMRELVRTNGYLKAVASSARQIDDAKKEVHLTVKIEPGERYTFGKLTLRGLDILSEPTIRKIWTMQPGMPFNPTYPEFFLARVRQDGVFDNLGKTKSEVKLDEENKTADVTLYFAGEGPPPKKKVIR